MRSTGIVRRVDELGRLVLPVELRRTMNIGEKDGIEIFTEEDRIILRKYQPSEACAFCGEGNHLREHRGKWVCQKCVDTFAGSGGTPSRGGEKR